jgi:hypothetical protein
MYILGPYQTAEFKGWRASNSLVNRFYFTSSDDSYSAAFNDVSAMGVIAMAVYPEVRHCDVPVAINKEIQRPTPSVQRSTSSVQPDRMLKMQVPKQMSAIPMEMDYQRKEESAGTGYGREVFSPTYTIKFESEKTALEKVYIKYEWRDSLCRKGIIACKMPRRKSYNRMWNDGYAPPPPSRTEG